MLRKITYGEIPTEEIISWNSCLIYSGSQISEVRSRLLKTLQDEALGVSHTSEKRYSLGDIKVNLIKNSYKIKIVVKKILLIY